MFAKIFGTDDDQIVVMRDDSDNGKPQVSFFYDPHIDGYGVCKTSIIFNEGEEESADIAFAKTTEEDAKKCAKAIIETIRNPL